MQELAHALETLLDFSRDVTEGHIRKRGSAWPLEYQIARMHEEVSEVYRAIRKDLGLDRTVSECIDSIFASLTMLSLLEGLQEKTGPFRDLVVVETVNCVRKVYTRAGLPITEAQP
jgi:hypothetical protein